MPKAKKIKFFCYLTFFIHIQWKLYVKDKFCTLFHFNYTFLNVNYMLSNNYSTLLKVNYMLHLSPRGYFHIRRSGGLGPDFASKILVGAPNFASKNINDKYPKFCPLNFRYDPKIGTFSQLLRLVVTELPKFFLVFGELGQTLPQILPPNLM